jgi:hypothetical protein
VKVYDLFTPFLFFVLFCFVFEGDEEVLVFELKALCLARQVLYHLSHTSRPFYSGYNGYPGSLFSKAGLEHNISILS